MTYDLFVVLAGEAQVARLARDGDHDRASDVVRGHVRRDVDSGITSGEVRSTPTVFIDGVVHRGSYDPATLLRTLAR